jgi:antirestriction protein ArdC
LVAELGAALLAQRYGMTKYIKDDSAAYLKGWLKDLKEDPSFIKTVLLDVKKSSAMVIEHIDGLKVSQDVSVEVKDEQAQADSATLEASEQSSEENEQRAARGFHR